MEKREIRFRAWDKTAGDLIPWEGMYGLERTAEPPGVGVHVAVADQCYLMPEDCIIEQYTGLCDRNGREIYEGDVVRAEYDDFGDDDEKGSWVGPVIYEGAEFKIDAEPDYKPLLTNTCLLSLEILGNVHEHPDLLQVCAPPTSSTS